MGTIMLIVVGAGILLILSELIARRFLDGCYHCGGKTRDHGYGRILCDDCGRFQ